jgi:hypothetical protein
VLAHNFLKNHEEGKLIKNIAVGFISFFSLPRFQTFLRAAHNKKCILYLLYFD